MYKLINGETVQRTAVMSTLINAEALAENDYIAFFEAMSLAKDKSHQLYAGVSTVLDKLMAFCREHLATYSAPYIAQRKRVSKLHRDYRNKKRGW